ncbi:phage tail protein [Weissella confusa]|uniref:phage tail protein n=1 Tax=Weissella confusa TaxID=1583 RepID=UPI001C6FA818|nr:phage tail protein [Weissella confusa]QYU58215.1 phage tail protein [Weissella confusa]
MIKFTTHLGESLLALADIKIKTAVNGEKSITGTIYTNNDVLNYIDRGWTMEFENETYYITFAKPKDNGQSVTVEFDAIHEFFYKMGKSSVYSQLSDGSHTAEDYLSFIFKGSEYTYTLAVAVPAFEKQSFGMKNRLSLFNDFIDATGTEFSILGKKVIITDEVGSDLSTVVRKGFNMQELNLEYNIGDFVTYAKGFGAYNDEDDHAKGRLTVEYTSPLAKVYGKLEADPVSDERYTKTESLLDKLKSIVEGSYSISVSTTLEDLQKSGYEYELPTSGDYVMLIDETLGFSRKVRIVSTEVEYDVMGVKQATSVTLNSISAVDEHIETSANSLQTINDIANGSQSIPNAWLDDATQQATTALRNAQTELKFTKNGILAIDKTNANNVVIFNSAGIGVSTNGGKSFANAMTGDGINATTITSGSLNTANLKVLGLNSIMSIANGVFSIKSTVANNDSEVKLSTSGLDFTMMNGTVAEKVGGIVNLSNSASVNQNGTYLYINTWDGVEGSINAGDEAGIAMVTERASDGTASKMSAPFLYNATGIGREKGFHFFDRIIPDGAINGMKFSWISWSDWTDKIPVITDEKLQGGIAFPVDGNVILYSRSKRVDLNSL